MTFLCKLASHCLIDLGVVTGLCSVLFAMVQKILDATDEETLQVLAQRLAWNDIESRFTGHLLQVDEAIACVDQNDAKLITDQQKDAEDHCLLLENCVVGLTAAVEAVVHVMDIGSVVHVAPTQIR